MLCWCCGALRVAAGCAGEFITRSAGAGIGDEDVVAVVKRIDDAEAGEVTSEEHGKRIGAVQNKQPNCRHHAN